jgi:hypothetical protein
MTAVDLFYDDLAACAADLTEAATQLQFDASRLRGDDPGVGAPLGRPTVSLPPDYFRVLTENHTLIATDDPDNRGALQDMRRLVQE